MWQGHLIRPAPPAGSGHPPPSRRVYTPTADGFENFLRACVGLPPVAGVLTLDLSS
jgi:hypothetical protein